MNKDEIGAEPKNKRIKRYYSKSEVFHIGVSRDEWCCFRSMRSPVTAINGYFFNYNEWFAKNHSIEDIENFWKIDNFGNRGFGNNCFAVVDRNRKKAIIVRDSIYGWEFLNSIPNDFKIYQVEEVPCFNPFGRENKRTLYNTIVKTMIIELMNCYADDYKVLNSNSKICYVNDYIIERRKKVKDKIIQFIDKYGCFCIKRKPIINSIYVDEYKVKFPSVEDVINDNLFTDEEIEHINKCIFYTKYIYNKDNKYKWKDVDTNWNKYINDSTWQEDIANKLKEKHEKSLAYYKECRKKVREEIKRLTKEFLSKKGVTNYVDYWRNKNNNDNDTYINYKDCRLLSNDTVQWFDSVTYLYNCNYLDNIQLKLRGNDVVTSRGAVVKLDDAINLFNKLYTKYLVKKDEDSVVFNNRITISYYNLRFIRYKEKTTDKGKPLGYKEWLIQIGCHSLWFDDIKDFARYYNLQDRLSFPVDKTTDECRNNNLIHLIKRNNNDRK